MFLTPVLRHATYHPVLRSVDRNFERFFNEAVLARHQASGAGPSATFEQSDTHTTVQLDLPGVSKEQLSIGIEGVVVRIESLADAPRRVKVAYELPHDIDASNSTAKLENGVLVVTLAKKLAVSKVTPVAIQ
jgi:HSP20 family molecular chaperone IbpA